MCVCVCPTHPAVAGLCAFPSTDLPPSEIQSPECLPTPAHICLLDDSPASFCVPSPQKPSLIPIPPQAARGTFSKTHQILRAHLWTHYTQEILIYNMFLYLSSLFAPQTRLCAFRGMRVSRHPQAWHGAWYKETSIIFVKCKRRAHECTNIHVSAKLDHFSRKRKDAPGPDPQ